MLTVTHRGLPATPVWTRRGHRLHPTRSGEASRWALWTQTARDRVGWSDHGVLRLSGLGCPRPAHPRQRCVFPLREPVGFLHGRWHTLEMSGYSPFQIPQGSPCARAEPTEPRGSPAPRVPPLCAAHAHVPAPFPVEGSCLSSLYPVPERSLLCPLPPPEPTTRGGHGTLLVSSFDRNVQTSHKLAFSEHVLNPPRHRAPATVSARLQETQQFCAVWTWLTSTQGSSGNGASRAQTRSPWATPEGGVHFELEAGKGFSKTQDANT